MGEPAYTLALYRVRPGEETAFVAAWDALSRSFTGLPDPPLWGTLVRSTSDPGLFYSFGAWRSLEHIRAMRAHPATGPAFESVASLCTEMTPGSYELVRHVEVAAPGQGS